MPPIWLLADWAEPCDGAEADWGRCCRGHGLLPLRLESLGLGWRARELAGWGQSLPVPVRLLCGMLQRVADVQRTTGEMNSAQSCPEYLLALGVHQQCHCPMCTLAWPADLLVHPSMGPWHLKALCTSCAAC